MKGFINGNAIYKYVDIDANKGLIGGFYDNLLKIDFCNISNLSGLYAHKVSNSRISSLSSDSGKGIVCDSVYRGNIENCELWGDFKIGDLNESVFNNLV